MARMKVETVLDPDTGKLVQQDVPMTPDEEAERDAKETAWLADAPNRAREEKIAEEMIVLQKAQEDALHQQAENALIARGDIT